jgi:glutathione peroxidase
MDSSMTNFQSFKSLAVFLGCVAMSSAWAQTSAAPEASSAACPVLLNHTFPRLQDEKPQSLCQYSGKVILVVNTASYCGFTPQYKGLEALHNKYKDKGLVVLGFPSNDFAQEKANNQEIADFCESTFGVKFPMFTKTSVTGDAAAPFFKQLAKDPGQRPKWNFYKYLIGRDGRLIDSYNSLTNPDSKGLTQAIEKGLGQKAS